MPTRRQCKRAVELHEDQLTNVKGVVGLGIVKLDSPKRGATKDKNLNNAVAVYVRKAGNRKSSAAKVQLPKFVLINGRGGAKIKVPIEIVEQGDVSLETNDLTGGLTSKKSLGKEPM